MSKKKKKRITVKIGTRVLAGSDNRVDRALIKDIAGQTASLIDSGSEVIIVTSGAIGAGLGLLDIQRKGRSLWELQAIASIGQNHLMDIYNEHLGKRGYAAGQMLLTQEDLNDRRRFLNIKHTLNTLLRYKAVPVINENDSVSTEEIKCGDNDRLSALVADLAGADMLILLTDVEGLRDAEGKRIENVEAITGKIRSFCRGKGCEVSTGGMITKLEAVKSATHAGIDCVIAGGKEKNVITRICSGEKIGTYFSAQKKTLQARKRWIAYGRRPRGSVTVDEGAEKAISLMNKSLLPGGIKSLSGVFIRGDVIDIIDGKKRLIARGLSNYSSLEIQKIKGKRTDRIEAQLGYKGHDEVVHKDDLVVLEEEE